MKTMLLLAFIPLSFRDNQSQQYTATVPATGQNQNSQTNPLGSGYASRYGYNVSAILQRETRRIIYDAAPKQYLDLKILSMKTPIKKNSDEFYYHEMGFGRDPIICDAIGSIIASGTTQTVPILKETRFTVDPETLDKFVADLQGVRLQMNQIMDNCKVINNVITALNNKSDAGRHGI